ncbi:MAG TPA: glycosyltransferase family 2 protein [Vicinamibacterales bacterium]|nr:glycosyltransferase family 2 protein [Vicinamibacterales bacterium]
MLQNGRREKAAGAPPRVTVGVPVFNGEAFLEETLNSLLAQTYHDFEVIVSDNGSTDRTEEICRACAARDPRVRYVRSDVNRGAAWNHNRLFELAQGELFKWNSADDVCAPEFLLRCVEALDRDPAAVLACGSVLEIDELGAPLTSRTIPAAGSSEDAVERFGRHVELDHLCIHIYGVIRSSVLRRTDRIGSFTDSDRVLLAHLALFGHFIVLPETLFFNRHHPKRSTQVYVGWRSRTVWFDPDAAHRKLFPFWTEFFAFWGVIRRSPLSGHARARCRLVMLRWLWHYKKYLFYEDLSYYPRQWVARRVPGAKALWSWLKHGAPDAGMGSAK